MTDSPPHLYIREGVRQGHDPEVVARASARRAILRARGSKPILSLRHLAQLTGVSYRYLRTVVQRSIDPYQDIAQRKKDGRLRQISSPEPLLMDVQRWILQNVLSTISMHPSSFAYQTGKSIVKCAEEHVGASWLVKMDLHDFFGSIEERRVYSVFSEMGYSKLLSLELARLCTRARVDESGYRPIGRYTVIRSYAYTYQGVLPQGAPTSGALANAIATSLDRKLHALATAGGYIYTRYSDDLTFSAGAGFDRAQASKLIEHVGNLVQGAHLALHVKKTHVVPPGARHVVLGLLVDSDSVRLLPEYKRRIEVHIRGVDTFGLVAHSLHRHFDSVFSFVNHVDGLLAFASGVETAYASGARSRWDDALRKWGYP